MDIWNPDHLDENRPFVTYRYVLVCSGTYKYEKVHDLDLDMYWYVLVCYQTYIFKQCIYIWNHVQWYIPVYTSIYKYIPVCTMLVYILTYTRIYRYILS
jgi:hypothetical protein